MTRLLEVEDLKKSFRPSLFAKRVPALRGVSFAVEQGRCFGLLGRNGAGKTTTLKILTGLIRADSGLARLLEKPAGTAAARRCLGYLPENPYFHEHLTPNEGLDLLGRLSGLDRDDLERRGPPLLERVGLLEDADRPLRGFSKGMRQRFGLAAALLSDPRLLLLDEPMSGLDPAGRHLVKEILLEEHARGKTILLSSHVLADVEELCDQVAVLNEGVVVCQGPIAELVHSAPRSFELCVERITEPMRARILQTASKILQIGERLTVRIHGADDGPRLAAEVQSQGGRLLALIPERETLEQWFVKLTAQKVKGENLPPLEVHGTAAQSAGTGRVLEMQDSARVIEEVNTCA